MADARHSLVIAALSRAAASSQETPLFESKSSPGLFGASASARQAAQFCKSEGYLEVRRISGRGKSRQELCSLTDSGMSFLLAHRIIDFLTRWQESGCLEDCSLPELYRRLQELGRSISIGRFHDLLRDLHTRQVIYLHPWTGPLYELPMPALAILVGHEIAYYASLRKGLAEANNRETMVNAVATVGRPS